VNAQLFIVGFSKNLCVCLLYTAAFAQATIGRQEKIRSAPAVGADSTQEVRLLAVGDINLGRHVGQMILKGDTLFPFAEVGETFRQFDIVFGNLESNISDQQGRTEDPGSNTVFTAPPAAAWSLAKAGFKVLSTANNHALDFGLSARNQTMRFLDSAGIAHVGTGGNGRGLYGPVIMVTKGISIALFAVTDLMNGANSSWKSRVAAADTAELLPAIREARTSVNFIIVSYHGGDEYAERPSARTKAFAWNVLNGGADVFLGHHPHVPYGIDMRGGKIAVYSLGNFVFKQPSRLWTRLSFAFAMTIARSESGTRVSGVRIMPVRVDFQPVFLTSGEEADKIRDRVMSLSSREFAEQCTW